jgi:hypothetical protein
LGLDGMSAGLVGLGVQTSTILSPAWSVHLGATAELFQASGVPDFSRADAWLGTSIGSDGALIQEHIDAAAEASLVGLRAATDIRLNRRDSIVVQAQSITYYDVHVAVEAKDAEATAAVEELPDLDRTETLSLTEAYACSVAWQFSWRRADLRIGLGSSSEPGLWLLQSTELAFRFGGKTRRDEAVLLRAWRNDADDGYAFAE